MSEIVSYIKTSVSGMIAWQKVLQGTIKEHEERLTDDMEKVVRERNFSQRGEA